MISTVAYTSYNSAHSCTKQNHNIHLLSFGGNFQNLDNIFRLNRLLNKNFVAQSFHGCSVGCSIVYHHLYLVSCSTEVGFTIGCIFRRVFYRHSSLRQKCKWTALKGFESGTLNPFHFFVNVQRSLTFSLLVADVNVKCL